MQATAEAPTTTPTPETQLDRVATEAGLVGPAKQDLITAFLPDFSLAWSLSVEAKAINVTDPSQKDEIRKARDMRLQLREVRIASEKRRKALKEDSLRRGQAIDKVAKVITQIAEPAEAKLLEMETIAERLEAERKARVRAERVMQLAPFGVDTTCIDLAGMEDAAFARLLEGSRLASEARERAKREAEEKRAADEAARKAEADRLKAENERLRKENEKREADARAARAEADRKLREEREAREKLEREDAERKRVEAKRLADEAKAKRKADRAPDAAKVRAIVAQLESIKDPGFKADGLWDEVENAIEHCEWALQKIAERLEGGEM